MDFFFSSKSSVVRGDGKTAKHIIIVDFLDEFNRLSSSDIDSDSLTNRSGVIDVLMSEMNEIGLDIYK